jgi:hypothetical protein
MGNLGLGGMIFFLEGLCTEKAALQLQNAPKRIVIKSLKFVNNVAKIIYVPLVQLW